MYFWISNAPITAFFLILRQFVVFIKVYLYLSHEATDAKKTLKYERGREIASDRNANDHNYLCVYSENCSEEFCSSVVKRWSDKHNNDASANNHGENQVTEVKYNLISATFPLQIHNWYPTVNNCTYKMLRNRKTRGDKNLMWLYVKQTGKDRKQKREFSGNHGAFSIPRDAIMENKVYLGLEKKTKQQHGETAQVQQISLLIIISMFAFMTASDVSKSHCSCRGEMFSLWRLDFAWLWFLCRCNRLENLTWRHLWSFFFYCFDISLLWKKWSFYCDPVTEGWTSALPWHTPADSSSRTRSQGQITDSGWSFAQLEHANISESDDVMGKGIQRVSRFNCIKLEPEEAVVIVLWVNV